MGVVLSFLTCLLCVVLEIAPEPRGLAISNSLQVCVCVCARARVHVRA